MGLNSRRRSAKWRPIWCRMAVQSSTCRFSASGGKNSRVKLGFVSAILPDLGLEEVLAFASKEGFDVVELMCWPKGKADRRYAGVTHIDVTNFAPRKLKAQVSALGYYPNPLCADEKEAEIYIEHLKRVISAAPQLGLDTVNTFVGRDHTRSVKDNWSLFQERWPGIVQHAEGCG